MINNYNKIFCIGLSRTGTTSLNRALEILGFNSMHYLNPSDYLSELLQGNYNWNIINRYDAVSDIPICDYFTELNYRFPNSKFILTIRPNMEEWLKSCQHQMDIIVPPKILQKDAHTTTLDDHSLIRSLVYGCINFDERKYTFKYLNHLHNVLEYFDPRSVNRFIKLLILDITNDSNPWIKLCNFLEKPIPNVSFPHLGARKK